MIDSLRKIRVWKLQVRAQRHIYKKINIEITKWTLEIKMFNGEIKNSMDGLQDKGDVLFSPRNHKKNFE